MTHRTNVPHRGAAKEKGPARRAPRTHGARVPPRTPYCNHNIHCSIQKPCEVLHPPKLQL
ncbi:hypothetical protein Hanom_Chr01g00055461 [Helianthus anomalus]